MGCGTEIPKISGAFPKHLLTSQKPNGPKVALQLPILSEAVDLADLVQMAETHHLQLVAGAARAGKFEYLFTLRVVPGSKATVFDTGGSAQSVGSGFNT